MKITKFEDWDNLPVLRRRKLNKENEQIMEATKKLQKGDALKIVVNTNSEAISRINGMKDRRKKGLVNFEDIVRRKNEIYIKV